MYANTLTHHGIKGQKWGVRRYQYADGTLTPAETFGLVAKLGKKTVSECRSYTDKKLEDYLSD